MNETNIVVIDTSILVTRLRHEIENDPLVHRLVELLRYGNGYDATDLIIQAIATQSKMNQELLKQVATLSRLVPVSIPRNEL